MVEIRKAKIADVPRLVDLWSEFFDDLNGVLDYKKDPILNPQYKKTPKKRKLSKQLFRSHIYSRNSHLLVAEANGVLVAYCIGKIQKNPEYIDVRKTGFICDLFVFKPFRKKKVGSIILDEMIAWFKSKKISHVALETYMKNKVARSFYQNLGFIENVLILQKKIK